MGQASGAGDRPSRRPGRAAAPGPLRPCRPSMRTTRSRVAEELVAAGASRLHVVDLDAARDGARPARALPDHRPHRGPARRARSSSAAASAARPTWRPRSRRAPGAWSSGRSPPRSPRRPAGSRARPAAVVAASTAATGACACAAGRQTRARIPSSSCERLVDAGVRDVAVTAIDRDGTGAGPGREPDRPPAAGRAGRADRGRAASTRRST